MSHLVPIISFAVTVLALFLVTFGPYFRQHIRLPRAFREFSAKDRFADRYLPQSAGAPVNVKIMMQVLVSLVFLCAAVFIILSHEYNANDKHWAYGSAGTILGFWLKH